ncbi:STAS domain-containing protein [Vibrio salinus]|uniref:STAS domain-containing protein n=1 Tax=Vibrio salinus TaxID=2899784 RepID=UPI001E4CA0E6|nr:STAS domain-containing protein [Vibrio salinus]MCE0495276.1 STAS domain-containing protein [Vibrio salinus]
MSSVKRQIDQQSKCVTIEINGSFNFRLVEEFRQCYTEMKGYRFVLDFRKVDYIDSAGLGMLLNMQNYLSSQEDMIRIINVLPQVQKILAISRFDKKFNID